MCAGAEDPEAGFNVFKAGFTDLFVMYLVDSGNTLKH